MTMRTIRRSRLLLAFALAAPFAHSDEPRVAFQGEELALDALPAALQTPTARATLLEWSAWCAQEEYHLLLDDSARVLLVTKKTAKSNRKELAMVGDVLARADRLFPMPSAPAQPTPPPAPPAQPEPEPEPEPGPDSGPPGLPGLSGGDAEASWQADWTEGVTLGAQRDALPTLVLVDGDEDLAKLLEFLAARHADLGAWIEEAKGQAGFVLVAPLLGAWLTHGADLEEWSPLNELVNRLLRILIVQRHGRVPEWLSQGLAWDAERELMKGIYSYSRRHEFVWASEHTAWDSQLAGHFRQRDEEKEPLTMPELATLTRAGFDPEGALLAYGGARFLTIHHPDSIAPLMAALARDRETNCRKVHDDGTWTMVPVYEAPASTQAALLEEIVVENAMLEMTRFFKKGRNYRQ